VYSNRAIVSCVTAYYCPQLHSYMSIEKEIKQERFESVFQKALVNLLYTSELIKKESASALKQFDLTTTQYNILRILGGSHPHAMTPGEIKSVMISKQSDLTRLMDRMQSKGIIKRKNCPENRRQVKINISETGVSLLDEIKPYIDQIHHTFFESKLSAEEAADFSKLLDQIRL